MTTHLKIGAKRDGTLTALDAQVVSNTGAYGNHASETLAAAMASPFAAYRCDNKKGIGRVVYTNMVPGGGFRGYGASQTTFAMECAMDELARILDIDPFEIRRRNVVRPGDNVESIWKEPSDASFGSHGIEQCLEIVEKELRKGNGVQKPEGDDWLEILGCGMVHPNVLRNCGLDPDVWQGFAFGCGVDRLGVLKYGMPDLRDMFASDVRWLAHYGFSANAAPNPATGLS